MNSKQPVRSYFSPIRPSASALSKPSAAPSQLNGSSAHACMPTPKNDKIVTKPLPPGIHSGLGHLKPHPGVYRCLLRRVRHKANPDHADYVGVLPLSDSQAWCCIWLHADGSLGLRVEKLPAHQSRREKERVQALTSIS